MTLPFPTLWMLSWTVLYGAGALVPLVGHLVWKGRWREHAVDLSMSLAVLGSLVGAGGAAIALVTPDRWGETVQILALLQRVWGQGYLPKVALQIRVDSLSASFALLIAAFAAVVAVFSFDALRARHFQRQKAWIAGAFNVFVWATLMVVVVNDLFSLIIVLEIMTLAFGWLTLYKQDHYQEADVYTPTLEQRKDSRLAPQIYLIVSHVSTAFVLIACLLLAHSAGGLSFDDLRKAAGELASAPATIIFLLALIGLGIRAGLVPAHFWVSLVHPSSPTTTHAFSLGIAIKVAIYLMIRFFFQFLKPQVGWGYLLLILSVITAVVSVWYAIASHDLKKALAYHSVENVGIIAAGVGMALLFQAKGLPALAVMGLVAGFYHLLNHAVFKGLLYLCTGAIERQTDQIVNIEQLGGLLKIWPWTGRTFLIGAFSISGFPPFNGFISEWLTLQALLGGVRNKSLNLTDDLVVILSIVFLVASFALTAFCFVKITGLALLGQPRAKAEIVAKWRQTPDVPWSMRSTMALLAALCLLLGIFPLSVANLLGRVARDALGRAGTEVAIEPLTFGFQPDLKTTSNQATAMLSILAVACLLGCVAWIVSRMRLRGRTKLIQPTDPWNCGTPYVSLQMQYTGAALSFLIRDLFGKGWEPADRKRFADYLSADLLMSDGAAGSQSRERQVVIEVFRAVYNHFIGWLLFSSERIETFFQNGEIRRYLVYILVAYLGVLMLFLVLTR